MTHDGIETGSHTGCEYGKKQAFCSQVCVSALLWGQPRHGKNNAEQSQAEEILELPFLLLAPNLKLMEKAKEITYGAAQMLWRWRRSPVLLGPVGCGVCSPWGRAVAWCAQTLLFSLALQSCCWDSTAQHPGGWGYLRAVTKCTLGVCAVVC